MFSCVVICISSSYCIHSFVLLHTVDRHLGCFGCLWTLIYQFGVWTCVFCSFGCIPRMELLNCMLTLLTSWGTAKHFFQVAAPFSFSIAWECMRWSSVSTFCQHSLTVFCYSHLFHIQVECDLIYCGFFLFLFYVFYRGKFLEMCNDLLARVEPPLRSVLEQTSKYFCDWICLRISHSLEIVIYYLSFVSSDTNFYCVN